MDFVHYRQLKRIVKMGNDMGRAGPRFESWKPKRAHLRCLRLYTWRFKNRRRFSHSRYFYNAPRECRMQPWTLFREILPQDGVTLRRPTTTLLLQISLNPSYGLQTVETWIGWIVSIALHSNVNDLFLPMKSGRQLTDLVTHVSNERSWRSHIQWLSLIDQRFQTTSHSVLTACWVCDRPAVVVNSERFVVNLSVNTNHHHHYRLVCNDDRMRVEGGAMVNVYRREAA